MNKRKPIKKQHERAVITDFLNWYNSINGTRFSVIAEPEPPEAVAKYEDKYLWLEVGDVYYSDDYAKDLNSYATPNEEHKRRDPGPCKNMDEKFALKFEEVLKDKLSKNSYKPYYELYGPGILILVMHNPWFDEKTMAEMHSQYSVAKWDGNREYFGKVFIAFLSEGRTFYEWDRP